MWHRGTKILQQWLCTKTYKIANELQWGGDSNVIWDRAPFSVCSQFRLKAGDLCFTKGRKLLESWQSFSYYSVQISQCSKDLQLALSEWEGRYLSVFQEMQKEKKKMLREVNGSLYICTLYWEGIILPIIHNFLPGIIFKSQEQLTWNKVQCPVQLDKDLETIPWRQYRYWNRDKIEYANFFFFSC